MVLGFVAMTATSAFGASEKLLWAPPILENPIIIQLSADGTGDKTQLDPNRDYIIKLPADAVRTKGVWIEGGRNVIIMGGHIALPYAENLDNNDSSRRAVYIKNNNGIVHVEGLLIDGTNSGEYDAIAVASPNSIVQLQNIHVTTLAGSYANFHGDLVQPWGGVEELRIDRFTGTTSYQGLQIDQDSGRIGSEKISNVNMKGTGQYKLWLTGKEIDGHNPLIQLNNVYIEPAPKWDLNLGTSVYPAVGMPQGAIPMEGGTEVWWPELPWVQGVAKLGPPPGGDFVPVELVGTHYFSPWWGDVNLDGVIDAEDYRIMDMGYLLHESGWTYGDFNYDGVIDAMDYALIDAGLAYQSGLAAAGMYIDLHTAMFGEAYTTALAGLIRVPEPASLALLALGGAAMLRRRRYG